MIEKSTTGVLVELTRPIIGAAIEVHRELGPGLMESAYEQCLCHELTLRKIAFERQVPVPVNYKGVKLDCTYRADLIIGDVVLEVNAIEAISPIHEVQLMSYLRLLKKPVGLLINFHSPVLKDGIRRRVFNP
jgi:GxxExxY protein